MLTPTRDLLQDARLGKYAVGAFNVYNLEGIQAVIDAAESLRSPAILQIDSSFLHYGGKLVAQTTLIAGEQAAVPVAVQLDHSSAVDEIQAAVEMGVQSIMIDGSAWLYATNMVFTRDMAVFAHAKGVGVEAELGYLAEGEDEEIDQAFISKLTVPEQAAEFVEKTGVDFLAVCVGNIHGRYSRTPVLDYDRLRAIQSCVSAPLVLHGSYGVPDDVIERCVQMGICKVNVDLELYDVYVEILRNRLAAATNLPGLMRRVTATLQTVVAHKLEVFGCAGRA